MPKPLVPVKDIRKLFFLLGMAGLCVFVSALSFKALALDADSAIFDKKADPSKSQVAGQPLSLPEEVPNPSPGIFSTLIRFVLALSLVVGLIVLTVWGLKIIWEKRGWGGISEESKVIKVLSSTYLAPRKAIHLVEVGKRILVIGVGQDEVNCLDVITEPSEVETLRKTAQHGFQGMFGRVLQKHEVAQQEEETRNMMEESKKVVGGYVEKLKEISKRKKEKSRTPDGSR